MKCKMSVFLCLVISLSLSTVAESSTEYIYNGKRVEPDYKDYVIFSSDKKSIYKLKHSDKLPKNSKKMLYDNVSSIQFHNYRIWTVKLKPESQNRKKAVLLIETLRKDNLIVGACFSYFHKKTGTHYRIDPMLSISEANIDDIKKILADKNNKLQEKSSALKIGRYSPVSEMLYIYFDDTILPMLNPKTRNTVKEVLAVKAIGVNQLFIPRR